MKVLLTGANGFVGSHILDSLLARELPVVLLLRKGASTRWIDGQLARVETRFAPLLDPEVLKQATVGVTHVIHCAGCTRSLTREGFFEANEQGTRNLLNALDPSALEVFVHISSLAVAGPATSQTPATESRSPAPVSAYGESKLAAEKGVRELCPSRHIILRPPAVYGPRDGEFFRLFEAVNRHLRPRPSRQELSLVYVKDLAETAVSVMPIAKAHGNTFNVASPEVITARQMADEIARQMKAWTVPVPLPNGVFWALCFGQECLSRVTKRANVLNMQKYAELSAPGWVCSTEKLKRELGLSCPTDLQQGIERSLSWYREVGWL